MEETLKRRSKTAQIEKARSLLDDPFFKGTFDSLYTEYVSDIECCELDGSQENEQKALECVRKLQTLVDIKRKLVMPIAIENAKRNLT